MKATESEIKKVKDEKDKLQSSLNMTKNDKLLLNTQKKHLADFYAVEKVWRSDIKKLEQQLKTTQQSLVTIHTDFKQSLKREVRLEKFIGAKFPDEKFLLKNGKEYESMEEVNKSKELLEAGEIPYVDESIQVEELTLLAIVQQSAERIEALSKDLESDRNTINDLIVEIDSISSGDSKYQEQCSQLLVSLTELQGKYRNSLDENSRLEHRITELKNSYTEIEDK